MRKRCHGTIYVTSIVKDQKKSKTAKESRKEEIKI